MVEVPPTAATGGMRSWGMALIVGALIFATLVLVPYVQPSTATMRSPLHHLRAVALHLAPGEDSAPRSDRAGGTAQPANDSSSSGPQGRAHPSLLAPRQPEQRQPREKQERKEVQVQQEQQQKQQQQQQTKQQAMQEEAPPPPPLQPRQQHPPPQRPQPLPQPPPADEQLAAAKQEVKPPAIRMQPIVEPLEDPEKPQEPKTPPAVTSSAEDWKEGMAFHAPQSRCTVQPNGERWVGGAALQLGVCSGLTLLALIYLGVSQPLPGTRAVLCCPQPRSAMLHATATLMPLPSHLSSLPGRVEYDPAPVPASGMPFLFDTSGLPSRESTCGADIDKGRMLGRCFG